MRKGFRSDGRAKDVREEVGYRHASKKRYLSSQCIIIYKLPFDLCKPRLMRLYPLAAAPSTHLHCVFLLFHFFSLEEVIHLLFSNHSRRKENKPEKIRYGK